MIIIKSDLCLSRKSILYKKKIKSFNLVHAEDILYVPKSLQNTT